MELEWNGGNFGWLDLDAGFHKHSRRGGLNLICSSLSYLNLWNGMWNKNAVWFHKLMGEVGTRITRISNSTFQSQQGSSMAFSLEGWKDR